jgi:hypothetical protein
MSSNLPSWQPVGFVSRFQGDAQQVSDGLRPPMIRAQLEERLIRAQAYFAKFPIPLEMDEDVPEILGVWATPAFS